MDRLCERPGCSERASVAYGMRAEDLVFWLDVLPQGLAEGGVLCRRHADAMVVPRGWTLDDLRDPDLHLFRPPAAEAGRAARPTRAPSHRRSSSADTSAVQLDFGSSVDALADDSPTADEMPTESVPTASPWTPDFDEADDLDGLLTARGPLLSRAFRVAPRDDD